MAEDPTHSTAGHRGLITVFGGTGFLGRRIVRHLLDHRFQVRAASRHPERVGSASQADARPGTTKADIRDETTVAAALFGAYGAVNAVSLGQGLIRTSNIMFVEDAMAKITAQPASIK